ncbi:MAG TPA: DUF454 domain-containing protein [Actinobacteria bacterium]|nr:DUF454 domain-containing protein [Actinomycetota bacterium]
MSKVKKKKDNIRTNKLLRTLFISLGTFFIGLGLIGIFIPILPTTPFLLLSAALYAKSSDKFYNWLIGNKLFGRYIKNYRNGMGIPARIKVFIILLLWTTIVLSIVYATDLIALKITLALVAISVTIHILLIKNSK